MALVIRLLPSRVAATSGPFAKTAEFTGEQVTPKELDELALAYAGRWCSAQGPGWTVEEMLGRGGTAPVFMVQSPDGGRALKVLDPKFSEAELGRQTELRIKRQVALGDHGCPYIVTCYAGGRFEDRLFLLMNRAEGQELEKRLSDVPRSKIRSIVDQVARAAIFLRSKELSHRDLKSANVFISDDFERVTVLDLSVLRDINDPVGIGTDHDNQLPVVATSRYTPPEYLFRLQDPSPELWHGVDIYQLGGLLHDLIMREPMFSSEYSSSSENRYRFAWIVATVDPVVRAADVDADLVLLARRALDKLWHQRRLLRLEDFLEDNGAYIQSLAAIGIAATPRPVLQVNEPLKPAVARDFARSVEEHVRAYLTDRSLRATHAVEPAADDLSWTLRWTWNLDGDTNASRVELAVTLSVRLAEPYPRAGGSADFTVWIDDAPRASKMALPGIDLVEGAEEEVARLIFAALGPLAAQAMSVGEGEN